MSIKAEHNLEKMVEEFEAYKKSNIFNDSELESILKNRRKNEYRIQKENTNVIDYLRYIEYEKKIQKIIKKRTVIYQKFYKHINNRILFLYKKAIMSLECSKEEYFGKLLKSYTDFCLKRKKYNSCITFLKEMCYKFPTDIDLYMFTSSLALIKIKFETARSVLLKALRIFEKEVKEKKTLYKALIEVEIAIIEYKKKNCELEYNNHLDQINNIKSILSELKQIGITIEEENELTDFLNTICT